MDAESESEVYFVSLISDRYGDASLDDCHATHCIADSLSGDTALSISPSSGWLPVVWRSSDCSSGPQQGAPSSERGPFWAESVRAAARPTLHPSFLRKHSNKRKNDTFATMEEWREECIAGFQFELREAAKTLKTFLKSSSTTSISQKAQKSAA